MSEFTTRVAVVTGGGSGIGKAVAIALAEAGAAVGVVDWNRANAERVAADLCGRGLRALAAVADVADEPAVETAFATIVEAFGDIDILFNNAGIDNAVPLVDMSAAVWDEMMRVNLRSLFVCTKAVLPAMQRKRWGRIINTASQSGYKGAPAMVHYCATKGRGPRLHTRPGPRSDRRQHHGQCDRARPDRYPNQRYATARVGRRKGRRLTDQTLRHGRRSCAGRHALGERCGRVLRRCLPEHERRRPHGLSVERTGRKKIEAETSL